jgi:hypothetical protein
MGDILVKGFNFISVPVTINKISTFCILHVLCWIIECDLKIHPCRKENVNKPSSLHLLNNNKPQRTTNQTGDGEFYTILESFIHCSEHRALTYAFNLFFASRDAKNRSVKAIIERGDSV